ncbi:PAS domain-containing sensor histidine kinase [Sulfurimonas sp.]|nr:PAS domain-containing sensor histidine kinase [Sulfurimonas sp.]
MNKNNQILTLTIVVLSSLVLSVVLLYKHSHETKNFHNTAYELLLIPQNIKYDDEVLTMSAYMATLTQNLKWIDRYDKANVTIEDTISKAIKKFPEISKHIDEISTYGDTLIALERESFELVKAGKFSQAHSLLFSKNYDIHKKIYTDKLDEIINIIETLTIEYNQKSEQSLKSLLLLASFIIVFSAVLGIVVFRMFLTQTKALEESKETLYNQYELQEKIMNSIPSRIFWKDRDGVYLGANQGFVDDAELTDVSEMIGKNDFDMTWSKSAEQFREDDAAVIASGTPRLMYEEDQPKEDGSFISLVTSKVPLRDVNDNIIGILGIYDDITEQKQLKAEKKLQDEQLLKQSRHAQMGEMISMIAHQWRQPLAAISATAATLQVEQELHGFEQESFNQQMKNITEYTQHLSQTIDDFRNFFKDEKSKANVSLESIVNDSISIIGDILKSKGIEVNVENTSDSTLYTYPNELKQVILNILSNAQEIIQEKEIDNPTIDIKIYKNNSKFCISIQDNAGGIPESIIEKLFEPYFTTKEKLNGSGLGLYMSKLIVEKHMQGKLSASNVGEGACFTIEVDNVDT